ncbi:MAG: signal peptidase I [Alphaproteobacteria bacterium]|nr:signal peptidase I [Alphaproteobacteria bacterium]
MASKIPRSGSGAEAKAESDSGGVLETLKTVVYAILFAVIVRTFAFEPFNIPSGSMIPTLLVGDYLFVSKFSYGYSKHSLPFSPPIFKGRIFESQPERGDVAVFKLPRDNKTDYIKRIIGLPGDRIQVITGILHVNGEPMKRRRVGDFPGERPGQRAAIQYQETLPGGLVHNIIETNGDFGPLDNTGIFTVPKGHYFAMGDNRDSSLDSRVLNRDGSAPVGFVPAENLVGRAEFLFFSTNGEARIWEIWKWPFSIRYSRLFNGIE